MAFLAVLFEPIRQYYDLFKVWEAKSEYDIKYQSGRVAHLEKAVNDVFDLADHRIFIGPGIIPPRRYIRLRLAADPLYIPLRVNGTPVYIYTRAAYIYGSVDFTVNVPNALNTIDTVHLSAVVDRYKRGGKTYKILFF